MEPQLSIVSTPIPLPSTHSTKNAYSYHRDRSQFPGAKSPAGWLEPALFLLSVFSPVPEWDSCPSTGEC